MQVEQELQDVCGSISTRPPSALHSAQLAGEWLAAHHAELPCDVQKKKKKKKHRDSEVGAAVPDLAPSQAANVPAASPSAAEAPPRKKKKKAKLSQENAD